MSEEIQNLAIDRAQVLFGSYRRTDANDPEIYLRAIAAVLANYPPDLMREVTDPLTGIQTTERFETWPPNAGELKRYCDEIVCRRARLRYYAELPPVDHSPRHRLPLAEPLSGRKANVLVPRGTPRYQEMADRAQAPGADPAEFRWCQGGIKVSQSWWEGERKACRDWEPVTMALQASPELARALKSQMGLPDTGEKQKTHQRASYELGDGNTF